MLATHPLTGKDIRILQTDASLWKERKTLAYVEAGGARPIGWDCISTGKLADGGWPTYVLAKTEADIDAAGKAKNEIRIFFVSKALADSYGVERFRENKIQNVMCLEEIAEMYPHLGGTWTGEDADAVMMLAGLVRYRYVAGAWSVRGEELGIKKAEGKPMRLWWITQYYIPDKMKRAREISKCLVMNTESPLIDKMVLLNEKREAFPPGVAGHAKVEERVIGHRLTYRDVFQAIQGFPDDVIAVFANADIAIDNESWTDVWAVNLEDKFLALLRYDVGADGDVRKAEIFGPRPDSQDTWVVRACDVKKRGEGILKTLDFPFGKMGCDNAIALDMLKAKFVCVNPSLSLRTWHFHSSGIRTYEKVDVLDRPMFHYVHPSGFHDSEPVLRFDSKCAQGYATLQRPVQGSGANEWLVATNRKVWTDSVVYKRESMNEVKPANDYVMEGKNMFVTGDGLFFDDKHMYIGGTKDAQLRWSKAQIHAMVPTMAVPRVLSAPWPYAPSGKGSTGQEQSEVKGQQDADTCREVYVVKFLSKILRLWHKYGPGEFFCPENKAVSEILEYIQWNRSGVRIIKKEKDVHVWAKEFVGLTPGNENVFLAEDAEALRKGVKGWVSVPQLFGGRLRIVIVEGGSVSAKVSRDIEDVLDHAFDVRVVYSGKSSVDRILDMMRGAWGVICGSDLVSSGWNWMLPQGAFVFNCDKEGDRAGLEISSACGLEHRFVQPLKDKVLEEVFSEEKTWKALHGVEGKGKDKETLPIVWMPNKDREGYFGHPGDSFREMVRLWAAAGYCVVKEHPTATMVWWGSIGKDGVLLYDRPNHDWRLAAPLMEKEWTFALFGNPAIPVGSADKASSWFFWPRRPSFVEEIVGFGGTSKGWADRKRQMVFYGKIENKVQAKRREASEWASAFVGDGYEWKMVKGDEAYGLTQREYLERLADSKFGLCLAGYGLKCHREVECMAMGCVPICDELVDMTNYAEPPVEGVHYIRVKSPEEARKAVEEMTEDLWEDMSASCKSWWERNCSCRGSFELTKKILEEHQKKE